MRPLAVHSLQKLKFFLDFLVSEPHVDNTLDAIYCWVLVLDLLTLHVTNSLNSEVPDRVSL